MTVASRVSPNAPFIAAITGRTPSRYPVWFMRQAGRSLPEYRKIRQGTTMLEACFTPQLAATITLQPVTRHDVDAAILFSDIVVPLKAAGVDLDIVPGTGPVIAHPVRTADDIAALPRLDGTVDPVAEAIGLILADLSDKVALIGFCGAPFTLASYLVEGGPSKTHATTKALMYSEPVLWDKLMTAITDIVIAFAHTQVEAGVDAMQLFDSWAGVLSRGDYERYVAPHSARFFAAISSVPTIHFGVGTGELLGSMAKAGPDVVGVDWRVALDEAAARIHDAAGTKAIQGNLDPAVLFAGRPAIREAVAAAAAAAGRARAFGHASGHVFNLGHGVIPATDPDAITYAVEAIHSLDYGELG